MSTTIAPAAPDYPRIRDLPLYEQAGLKKFLEGQTRPWIAGEPPEEQDAYFPWDYERWKARLFPKE